MLDEHRGAFEYDWRSRFHCSVTVVGRSMPWGEFYRLVKILAADPSSQVGVALSGWSYAFSMSDRLLADLFDLQHASMAGRKTKPYPRPWPDASSRRLGSTTLDPSTARAVLAAARG